MLILTAFLQINDVTNAMCLEIIEKFEPVGESREKGYLGVDGNFQDLATFYSSLLFFCSLFFCSFVLLFFENMHVELFAIQTKLMRKIPCWPYCCDFVPHTHKESNNNLLYIAYSS